jgi:GH24 family phage-related lysozyme (muramidase)
MKKISISTLIICLLILILPLIVGAQYDESCGDRCMDDPNYNECVNNCAKDMQEQEGGTIGNFKYNIPIGGNTDFNITESNKGRILGDFFNIWYGMLMGAIGVVATFMIAWGGFQYLSSRGDSTQIGNAKNTIISAITGLILAFTSYLILSVINPGLLVFKDLKLDTVEGIPSTSKNRGETITPGAISPSDDLQNRTKKFEGEPPNLKPHKDPCCGFAENPCVPCQYNVGYGHRCGDENNMSGCKEITQEEADRLLNKDLELAETEAMRVIPQFGQLSTARQEVLTDMVYSMNRGNEAGLDGFTNLKAAISSGDWERAGEEIRRSSYCGQVKSRCLYNIERMKKG